MKHVGRYSLFAHVTNVDKNWFLTTHQLSWVEIPHITREHKYFLPTLRLPSTKLDFCPRMIHWQKWESAHERAFVDFLPMHDTSTDSVFCWHTGKRDQQLHFCPRMKHCHSSIIANTFIIIILFVSRTIFKIRIISIFCNKIVQHCNKFRQFNP